MKYAGRIYKDGKFWLAEIPILDAMTQGRTRGEALKMAGDLVRTMANDDRVDVCVSPRGRDSFTVGLSDARVAIALLLRRVRQASGRSLGDLARSLGASSRNAYARYEQGASNPTAEKLQELWHAACPDCDIVLDKG